jgi:hypothetical protein
MKTVTKVLFTVIALLMAAPAFSQSNDQGTIQIGLGWLATFGGGTLKSEAAGVSTSTDVTGIRATYGLRGQYGLSENLSAGIWVRAEAATYVQSDLTTSYTGNSDMTYSGTSFGLEGKYYLANSDNFNFYPAIAVGYTMADNEFAGFTYATKYDISGINYSVGVGLNWYFVAEVFGISFDLDYAGSSLSGSQPADSFNPVAVDYTLTNGSITWGFGLTAHFGD